MTLKISKISATDEAIDAHMKRFIEAGYSLKHYAVGTFSGFQEAAYYDYNAQETVQPEPSTEEMIHCFIWEC